MRHAELFQPNAEELSILKNYEPLAELKVVDSVGISEGRQSRVSILEYGTSELKKRVIWKRMGVGKNLNREEAQMLEQRLWPYRQSLALFNWQVPEIYHSQVVQIENEYQIFSYDQYISGGDAEHMILNPNEPNFRKWYLLRKVLEHMSDYPIDQTKKITASNKELTLLPHGLDLKLANIVLADNKMYFVDFFGPKELTADGQWKTYSPKLDELAPPNLMAVTATREGAFLRLYRLLEKNWTETADIPKDVLREKLYELLNLGSLPKKECELIISEISNDYPWLDSIYKEQQV